MSSAVSFGTNTAAQRKRVMYFGTSVIYEGMPVCYDNSTTNVLGWDTGATTPSASTTTTEGGQNEGKFLRVENPNADNVSMFAGVVAQGKNVGVTGVATGKWVDIFIPNGAVVPVRTDNNCLIDQTILAITTGSQELGVPLATDSRPVAIARETKDRGTAGLVLAELCPYRFIHQDSGGTALSVDDADTGSNSIVNSINISSLQATGWCIAFSLVHNTVTTSNYSTMYIESGNTGLGTSGFHVVNIYAEAAGTAIAGDVNGIKSQANLLSGAGLSSAGICAGIFGKGEVKSGAGTISGDVVGGRFSVGHGATVAGDTAMLYFDHTGSNIDYLFKAAQNGAVALSAQAALSSSHGLKILVNDVAYYIMLDAA